MKKPVIVFFIFLVVLALPFIINAASGHLASADMKPDLANGTDSDATVCVDPKGGTREETKDYMRVNHQQVLKDERVKVVREGVKDERFQIERCFSCHEYKDFCKTCHEYNGVQPGCMDKTSGCHSTEKQPESYRPEGY